MEWDKLNSTQIESLDRDTVVVLPIAAIEQHGPHLPTGTDSMIAEGICATLDKALDYQLLILPLQKIGCSEHHLNFAGTLTLTHETFSKVIMETLNSVLSAGFRKILILNSHGGNIDIANITTLKLGRAFPNADIFFVSWWKIAKDSLEKFVSGPMKSVGHACEIETSLIMKFFPELVLVHEIRDQYDEGFANHSKSGMSSTPFTEFTPTGVWGYPSFASVEKGEIILEEVTNNLTKLLKNRWPNSIKSCLIH